VTQTGLTLAAPDGVPAAPTVLPVEEPAAGPGYSSTGGLFGGPEYETPMPYRVWASGDFLIWKIRGASLPGLTDTVPLGVIETHQQPNNANSPLLAFPFSVESTAAVASGGALNFNEQFGGRFTAGAWLDPEQSLGLESSFFFLSRSTIGFGSTTSPSVAESVITLPTNTPVIITSGIASIPETLNAVVVRQATSTLTGTASSKMWGTELNGRFASSSLGAVSGLVGVRYVNLQEDLGIHNSAQFALPAGQSDGQVSFVPSSLAFATTDSIGARNQFYGGQVGLDLDMFVGRFIIDLRAKIALGVMHESVDVFGSNVATSVPASAVPNQGVPTPGGMLSSPLDQGTHSRNELAFVPEVNLKLGYMITPNLRAYLGYDFLYLSNVVRPGDQTGISTSGVVATVQGTTSQITVSQPAFRFKDTDVWFNGINVGVELRF